MSRFDRYDKIAAQSVDDVFADPFIFTPMKRSVNGRPEPDPDRSMIVGEGIFSESTGPSDLQVGPRKRSGGNDFRMVAHVRTQKLNFDRDHLGGESPRQGDRVTMTSLPGEPVFEISSVRSDGASRLTVELMRIGGADA